VGRNLIALLGAVALCGVLSAAARAQVVALGASNTVGMGVRPQEAYPAQLACMIRSTMSGARNASGSSRLT